MKIPSVLRPGDRVAVVNLGAQFSRKTYLAGLKGLRELGLIPVPSKYLFKKDFIFAGTVEERLKSFVEAIKDKNIKAIWCMRGGYGAYAVAEKLAQLPKPKGDPKLVIGLSDVTAVHTVLTQKWKWVSIHGPLLARLGEKNIPILERRTLARTLFDSTFALEVSKGVKSLGAKKAARGELVGGNLSLLVSGIGTKWEIQTKGKILFLEDIGEPIYRLDRMLWQLRVTGKFKNVKAVVFDHFTDCKHSDGRNLVLPLLRRYFSRAKFPVLYGVDSGHGNLRLALPLGLKVKVSGGVRPQFEVLQSLRRVIR